MRAVSIKLITFAVFTLTITTALAANIGNVKPFAKRYAIDAAFEDATGVLKGDPVTLAGVPVGKVSGVEVERGLALLHLRIDRTVPVPRDSQVAIRYRNLIGQRIVALVPGASERVLAAHERIPASQTRGPLDLGRVFNNLRPLLATLDPKDIDTLSSAIVNSLGVHADDIHAIVADTAAISETLAARDSKIADLITSADTVVGTLSDRRDQLRSLLADFAKVVGTVSSRSGELDRILINLNTATGDLAQLVNGNRPALDRDLGDLATLLALVAQHQRDLVQITSGLDDTLRATTKATTYGEWANLYLFSLCQHPNPGCDAAPASGTSTIRTLQALGLGVPR